MLAIAVLAVEAPVFAAELAAPAVAVLAVEAAVLVLPSDRASDHCGARASLADAAHLAGAVGLLGERA